MAKVYETVVKCRVCRGPLVPVLDLGEQCLGGQFPLYEEDDPPRAPLVLTRCAGACGLVQLGHVVRPELLFSSYFYRSSVSATMCEHLRGIADEACALLGRHPERVLDIGCNDLALLGMFNRVECWGIDPCNVPMNATACTRIKGFFPDDMPDTAPFDLIFSIACFYDVNDPLRFARNVKQLLTLDGLWCLEVANLGSMVACLGYDSICHEHVTYYSLDSLKYVLREAGLKIVKVGRNDMNGGSIRVYAALESSQRPDYELCGVAAPESLEDFSQRVQGHSCDVADVANRWAGKKVHLLGASTKLNTVLQYCGLDWSVIDCASDRDPRKVGRRTPGTRIPIVSEEESRARKPDVYVTVLGHFRDELLAREEEFLKGGGSIVFLLPQLEEVRWNG